MKDGMMDKDSMHKEAKMQILEELRDMAMKMMGEKLSPEDAKMQEVTVMAQDPEGLKEGLEMAEDVLPEKESLSDMAEMESEDEDMDLDEIEEQIRELEELRRKKMMGV